MLPDDNDSLELHHRSTTFGQCCDVDRRISREILCVGSYLFVTSYISPFPRLIQMLDFVQALCNSIGRRLLVGLILTKQKNPNILVVSDLFSGIGPKSHL
jgi:hypothetical protein